MTREEFEHIQYAKDKDGNLVFIDDVITGETYYCQFCGGIVIPKRGKIKLHHFAHKNVTPSCSYETYLHRQAKERIYKWLLNKNEIFVYITETCKCVESCAYSYLYTYTSDKPCHKVHKFNIKKYFHPVGIEKQSGKFVADILMESNNEKHIPLFIEIFVNHKCSDDKIKSGYKIIEFKIESEEDINKICESDEILYNAIFYGFDSNNNVNTPNCYKSREEYLIEQDYKAKKYVMLSLTENGWINKTYVSKKDLDENKDNTVFKIIEDSSSYPQTTQKEFAAIAQKKGFKIFKQCKLCKYFCDYEYNYGLCCLYKKLKTPKYPYDVSTKYAMDCQYFKTIQLSEN